MVKIPKSRDIPDQCFTDGHLPPRNRGGLVQSPDGVVGGAPRGAHLRDRNVVPARTVTREESKVIIIILFTNIRVCYKLYHTNI